MIVQAPDLRADPFVLSVNTADILIPLNGESGTLTVYSDGTTPETSGFNELGSQSFPLAGNSTSTGTLILSLVLSGYPLGNPISAATIQFTVNDLDCLVDLRHLKDHPDGNGAA